MRRAKLLTLRPRDASALKKRRPIRSCYWPDELTTAKNDFLVTKLTIEIFEAQNVR